mmetsp:Transcript_19600/g.27981  ORF Transcript_19600/g.27981 Transcript_19600/m.27981 type:complete len:193 (-) Transcript_19600:946-1524(-)
MEIYNRFGKDTNVNFISHDNYYRCNEHLSMEERAKINFDHPDALETDLLISHISALKRGETVEIPTYDFTLHKRNKDKVIKLTPKPIILVEGILIFSVPELVKLFDCKVYVDADTDIRLIRRIKRDSLERGREHNDIIEQYLKTVRPMHAQFVEPSKFSADVIVSTTNPVGLAMVIDHIQAKTKIPSLPVVN